ncbi:MAG: oleate hydratase, partial [bacterium]
TYDLLSKIPSLKNKNQTLKDDFFEFNKKVKIHARARLMENGKIINAHKMQLNWPDRINLIKLLLSLESSFETKTIKDYFTADFFATNFWLEWSTTFAFEPWHSLMEMKRYLGRFIQDAPHINTMTRVLSAPYSEHDFFISPITKFLKQHKVNFKQKSQILNLAFIEVKNKKIVSGLKFKNKTLKINPDDLVFVTNGSMTADSSLGSMSKAPKQTTKKSNSWELWKNLAKKSNGFGKPTVFCNDIKKSIFESFTITLNDPKFFKLVEKLTGNKAGTGGLITFKNSNWLMSLSLPHQPYFINQSKNTFVCWGYGLRPDNIGNYIKKKMSACTGQEILKELCHHLGLKKEEKSIIKSAICLPVIMPYITSQFLKRKKSDRPLVVPSDSKNLAFIGQYVEIPKEIVFTVEGSIRSAKIAVKKLLNLKNKIPTLHQKQSHLKTVWGGIKTIMR